MGWTPLHILVLNPLLNFIVSTATYRPRVVLDPLGLGLCNCINLHLINLSLYASLSMVLLFFCLLSLPSFLFIYRSNFEIYCSIIHFISNFGCSLCLGLQNFIKNLRGILTNSYFRPTAQLTPNIREYSRG